jgi:hypothetical protein
VEWVYDANDVPIQRHLLLISAACCSDSSEDRNLYFFIHLFKSGSKKHPLKLSAALPALSLTPDLQFIESTEGRLTECVGSYTCPPPVPFDTRVTTDVFSSTIDKWVALSDFVSGQKWDFIFFNPEFEGCNPPSKPKLYSPSYCGPGFSFDMNLGVCVKDDTLPILPDFDDYEIVIKPGRKILPSPGRKPPTWSSTLILPAEGGYLIPKLIHGGTVQCPERLSHLTYIIPRRRNDRFQNDESMGIVSTWNDSGDDFNNFCSGSGYLTVCDVGLRRLYSNNSPVTYISELSAMQEILTPPPLPEECWLLEISAKFGVKIGTARLSFISLTTTACSDKTGSDVFDLIIGKVLEFGVSVHLGPISFTWRKIGTCRCGT